MTVRLKPDQSWLHTPQTAAPASSMAKVFSRIFSVPPCTPRIMPSRHQSGRYCRLGSFFASSAESAA